jgi:succinoglycan biosynthesis transport protein ExoP
LRRYAEQRVTLKAQIASESRTLLPGHPRMKELAAQLAGLDGEIRTAAEKAARGLENDAKLAAGQVETLNNAMAAQSKTVASGNADSVELRALELDARTARDQLESYVQKYREAIARDADNASPADARIISVAAPPRSPTFPKKMETLALGTLAGLLLSTGVVISHALLAGSADAVRPAAQPLAVRRRADQEELVEDSRPSAGESVDADEAIAEARDGHYRSIESLTEHLAAVAQPDAALRALVAAEGSGAALSIALTLGRALSRRGGTVLVDLGRTQDWFSDALFRDVEDDRGPLGMADLLSGAASFADVMHRDLSSDLDVIPVGLGAISTEGLDEALDALAASYQFVLVHASDWRSDAALEAMDFMHKVVIAAPAARLSGALSQARDALGGSPDDVLGFVTARQSSQVEQAA